MDILTIWFEIASNLFRTFLDAFEHTGDGVMKLIYSCEIAVVCPGQTGMMPKLSSFNKIPQVVSKQFPNQFQDNSPVSFKTIPHFFY